ncbi:conserved hypothetical protein [Agrobacterium deltaense Zutra 3/1]|uniref:Uncharacterized protein n=1 Tax=Agrobacterium deltaense Zutra 3/1 TaxID=1183427 RepID=A0A1S7QA11_9HYPH|nr:conserved hypothetical protein [Agrobacterium deltaense Zutra 3/1]
MSASNMAFTPGTADDRVILTYLRDVRNSLGPAERRSIRLNGLTDISHIARGGAIVSVSNFMGREMAHPKRFELLTPRFVVWCSIQLSYGCVPFRSFPVAWRSSKTSSFRMQAISLRNCHFSAAIHLSH